MPVTRRDFLKTAAGACLVAGAGLTFGYVPSAKAAGGFEMPPLPYPENALEPYISARTVSFHYGKHTAGYYGKISKFTAGTPWEHKSLAEILVVTADRKDKKALFNNAAQSWNHTFYWQGMKPGGGGAPEGTVRDALNACFGSYERFRHAFKSAASAQFGSGWAWLVRHEGKLKVVRTPNAVNPMIRNMEPLLTIDVWEHAYYLDYQNRRSSYIDAFLDHLVNWDFVAKNMA